jgi:diadenosine tetraphosphate (Ap4A) HIT family hydrolase
MNGPSALYHLPAARTDEQRERMERWEAEGHCVFCRRNRGDEPILETEHWYVVENDFPYRGTRAHLLIVPQRHVASFDELPDEAGADLWAVRRELKRRLDPPATATVERSGDMRYNGGSVEHLHIHFVALDENPSETVRFRVSARA